LFCLLAATTSKPNLWSDVKGVDISLDKLAMDFRKQKSEKIAIGKPAPLTPASFVPINHMQGDNFS